MKKTNSKSFTLKAFGKFHYERMTMTSYNLIKDGWEVIFEEPISERFFPLLMENYLGYKEWEEDNGNTSLNGVNLNDIKNLPFNEINIIKGSIYGNDAISIND